MNKIKYSFIVLLTALSIISCSKKDDDETGTVTLKPYDEQYAIDIANIEEYLKTNYVSVDGDYNVSFGKIADDPTQVSIWSYLNNDGFPKLIARPVHIHDVNYVLYYLVIREGEGERPMNVDGVLSAYSGSYLTSTTTDNVLTQTTTVFETVQHPNAFLNLFNVIRGWKEIFPQFKTGTYTENDNGTITYDNYGVGVMFVPSGLAYYTGSGSIPAYSPLIFSFKLYELQRLDHEIRYVNGVAIADPDGVLSMYEDLDGDGYVWLNSELNDPDGDNPDDFDKDGVPDFLDTDDDGDNYTTKLEIKNPVTGEPYPYDQIPSCDSGKKIYLDPTCHP